MKKLSIMILSLLLALFLPVTGYGQKIMKLDADLKASVKPIEAKRKGMSGIGKYEFGPYKIVSGKAGWTVTKSRSKMFSFETKSESKKKSSFVFVANDADTFLVNTSTNTKFSETDFGDWSWLNESVDNYIAVIVPPADTVIWRLALVLSSGQDVEGNFRAAGMLTDGTSEIEIREVKVWEDGKVPVMKTICGYEFYLNGRAIAAVQSSIDTFQKKYVWLSPDLNEKMKSAIAAAAASIMVHTDDALAAMDS